MWLRKNWLIFIISFLLCDFAFTQQPPVKKDSTTLYKDIEPYSKKNKFNTFIYSLIFKPYSKGSNKEVAQIVIGVLIKNENLIFKTFQMSVSFYPIIPGNGQNIIKMNSFRTVDFGYQDFEIGRPSIVPFR